MPDRRGHFSSLSHIPAIAALAVGAFSPFATLLIVALTPLGMQPVFCRVARESPHGQGSIGMLEKLLSFFLLGFTEAVAVAIPLVAVFLLLKATVVVTGISSIASHPALMTNWTSKVFAGGCGNGWVLGPAAIAFPLLVPGLSGFETGVRRE